MPRLQVGDGEALVFISGTSLDRTVWGPQVATFADRYRCITIDNRDVGRRHRSLDCFFTSH